MSELSTATETSQPSGPSTCTARGCTSDAGVHTVCEDCLTFVAIEMARLFETCLLESMTLMQIEPTRRDLDQIRIDLAGCAMTREIGWYQRHSPLGELPYTDALRLREKTDVACFLVAQGGVAALQRMWTIPATAPAQPDRIQTGVTVMREPLPTRKRVRRFLTNIASLLGALLFVWLVLA